MDLEEKIKKLIEYGEKSNNNLENEGDNLQNFVENVLSLDDLINIVSSSIWKLEDPQVLDDVFTGLSLHPSSQKKRMKIIECILSDFHEKEASNKLIVSFTCKICLQLEKLSTINLMKICTICTDYIQQSRCSSSVAWIEVLPKVLQIIAQKREVNHSGTTMSGEEYKREVIKSLCLMEWNLAIVVSLASMFLEMPLNNEEHEKVVRKLSGFFDKLKPQELPPLVHHLLQLCKEEHSVIVFIHLQTYFAKHIHKKPVQPEGDIESADKYDRIEAESTILCHIEESARISRIGDLIKLCKTSVNAADLVLDPFLLAVLLSLSCIPAYESQIMDALRSMLTHILTEEVKLQNSNWLHDIVNSQIKVEQVFSKLIHSRIGEHDKVLKGLINLAFVMLSSSGLKGREATTKGMWNIGRTLLVSLVKRHNKVTKSVLNTLTDRIITGSSSHQYTDSLFHLCNITTLSVLENLPLIVRILEFLSQLPNTVAHHIIVAILPLVRISSKLRDNLVLILRKALFSRELGTRRVAVVGFLKLLRFLKLQGLSTLSQNSLCQNTLSGPSVFTQMCIEVHSQPNNNNKSSQRSMNTNIAICLEVLNILKRCFTLQASVKISLYKGLFEAISVNPAICLSVLDILLTHLNQFYEEDVSTLPGLQLDKTVHIQGLEVVVQEPLGRLLLLIQDVIVKSGDIFTDEDTIPRSYTKLTEILQSLVDRFSKCDLEAFNLNEETDLTDVVPESVLMVEMVKQILSIYEALVAYMINSWNVETSSEHEDQLISLHKKYDLIINFVRQSSRTGGKKKDGNETRRRKKDQKTVTPSTLPAPKRTVFNPNSTILTFPTIRRLLVVFLVDEIEWMSNSSRSEIGHRNTLFRYAAQTCLDCIQQTKIKLNEEQKSSTVFNDVSSLSKLLFDRCLKRYDEVFEFDNTGAVICLECFSEFVDLINVFYHSQFADFLETTVFVAADDGLAAQLNPIIDVYEKILFKVVNSENTSKATDKDEDDDMENATSKSLSRILLNSLSNLIKILPGNDPLTLKVLDWLISTAEKYSFKNQNNTKTFVSLLLKLSSKCKTDLTLLDSMTSQLCHTFPSINAEENDANVRPLMVINDENKNVVLQVVCTTLMSYLEDAEWCIARFKAEYYVVPYTDTNLDSDENNYKDILRKKEKELCQRLTHIALMTQSISCIAVATGPSVECIFKLAIYTYSVINLLTKYFTVRSTVVNPVYQYARFNKLVKVAGTHLSAQVAELIIFVESFEMDKKSRTKQTTVQARRQAILIPKLVSTLENFTKFITLLSKKCKDTSLKSNVRLTTARDFRLNVKKLEEVINKQNESDGDVNDALNNNDSRDSEAVAEGNSNGLAPNRKRNRLS